MKYIQLGLVNWYEKVLGMSFSPVFLNIAEGQETQESVSIWDLISTKEVICLVACLLEATLKNIMDKLAWTLLMKAGLYF